MSLIGTLLIKNVNSFLFVSKNFKNIRHYIVYIFPQKCNARDPSSLKSTKIKKWLAIRTQLINFDDNELKR